MKVYLKVERAGLLADVLLSRMYLACYPSAVYLARRGDGKLGVDFSLEYFEE